MKNLISFALVIFLIIGIVGCSSNEEIGSNNQPSSAEYISDEIVPGLSDVLISVGIDPEEAEQMEQIEDWANGPRYSFPTHGTTARVYCNMDGSIESVRVGEDIELYKRGYETWSIDNFLVDDDLKDTLIFACEDAVSVCLNYPSSADFPLLDWSFGRAFDHYYVNSYVETSNAFGVESEIPFSAVFIVDGETIRLIGLQVSGEMVKDELDQYPLPDRQKIESEDSTEEIGELRLVDGELGEYGESIQLDGWDYIWYHVPVGKYDATCNSKSCIVSVDKNDITRNSSGYVEMENVSTYEFEYGETREIVVGENEHIFLTIYADVTLVPKQ